MRILYVSITDLCLQWFWNQTDEWPRANEPEHLTWRDGRIACYARVDTISTKVCRLVNDY
jgi:hypothetical protein